MRRQRCTRSPAQQCESRTRIHTTCELTAVWKRRIRGLHGRKKIANQGIHGIMIKGPIQDAEQTPTQHYMKLLSRPRTSRSRSGQVSKERNKNGNNPTTQSIEIEHNLLHPNVYSVPKCLDLLARLENAASLSNYTPSCIIVLKITARACCLAAETLTITA